MNTKRIESYDFPLGKALVRDLLSLYHEYLEEYDHLASRLMENIETHDSFMNWLGARKETKMQEALETLEENGYAISLPQVNSIIVDENRNPLIID
jgi:hypothetical protein